VSQPPILAFAAASRHYRRRSAGGRLIGNAGNALIEFALVAPILVLLLLNLFDFSSLIWSRMQTDYAAQMGAQAALKTCSGGTLPAISNCAGLNTAISNVSLASGYPAETYYCVSGTALQSVGTYSSPPSPFDCSAAGNSAVAPGDYVTVQVTYSYNPAFTGLSLATSQTMTSTALERLQ
jgi:Flp pilus assembly protein TadG